jgi:hypothetical protein
MAISAVTSALLFETIRPELCPEYGNLLDNLYRSYRHIITMMEIANHVIEATNFDPSSIENLDYSPNDLRMFDLLCQISSGEIDLPDDSPFPGLGIVPNDPFKPNPN